MKVLAKIAGVWLAVFVMGGLCGAPARAQVPVPEVVKPVIMDTAVPIIVDAVKPKPKNPGMGKFEGYVMHANIAQITVRAKDNETSLQTFTLSEKASAKMQTIVDRGGYQYGDKVTVYYDPTNRKAMEVKGKPSKPI